MLAVKHEQEKEAEMEQLTVKAMLEQVEKDKSWVEFLIQDLNHQKESTERIIEGNKDIINSISTNHPSVPDTEKVTRLIASWAVFSDLIDTKMPMVDNALKALKFENEDFKERVIKAYSMPLVANKLEILENIDLQKELDQISVNELFESVCQGGLNSVQEGRVAAWLRESSKILTRRSNELMKDHYREKGNL
jgi:hypothetical protein